DGDQRGGDDVAPEPGGPEPAVEPVPGRPGLVTAREGLRRPEAAQGLDQGGEVVGEGRQDGGRRPPGVGDGDDDGALVDVQTDVAGRGRMSHGPVLPVVALHWTPRASSVTHGDVSDWSNHSVYSRRSTGRPPGRRRKFLLMASETDDPGGEFRRYT